MTDHLTGSVGHDWHVNVPRNAPLLEIPSSFQALEPPTEVCDALLAGQYAILGGLTDEDLQTVGLSPEKVRSLTVESSLVNEETARALIAIWESSRSGDRRWLDWVSERLAGNPGWRYTLCTSWSVSNPFFDASYLDSGPIGTRANTLLFLADADLTVTDLQSMYFSIAVDMAAGKISTIENAALVAGTFTVGALVGIVTGGAGGTLVGGAANWAADRLTEVDGWVLDLTERWMLGMALLEHAPDRVMNVADAMYAEAGEMSRRSPSVRQGKRIRMLLATYTSLIETARSQEDTTKAIALPDVVGMRLNDAKAALAAVGVNATEEIDVGSPIGGSRMAWAESKWIVRGQAPRPGTPNTSLTGPVWLAYSRPEERVSQHVAAMRLANQS